ncbi:Tn3 family transposase [Rhodococcus sp. (in: high G+C Gram-positive bacteria)]|uniref:Tn3 family transposase n=1 Tax=Rhodococcus sp. TaxID=1831 RepID=UPI003BB1D0F7
MVQLQRGGKVPEAIITDTGSYSDIVFGLLHLIGIKFCSRQYSHADRSAANRTLNVVAALLPHTKVNHPLTRSGS